MTDRTINISTDEVEHMSPAWRRGHPVPLTLADVQRMNPESDPVLPERRCPAQDYRPGMKVGRPSVNAEEHTHEWVVFSTALAEGWLMLQCVGCGLHGTVEDPSLAEWAAAFSAPSRPYRWAEPGRVVAKGHQTGSLRYVVPASPVPRCDCYGRLGLTEPDQYERLPVEVLRPAVPVTEADRRELGELAGAVADGALCSRFLWFFLQCCEEHTGHRPGPAVEQIARRLDAMDRKGLHCSPGVVATVIRQVAGPVAGPAEDGRPTPP